MSRLIVKNLPNGITEERLRDLFSKKGRITDVQLKYTKEGKFRKFGFVGYQTEKEAAAAREHFGGTCIDTSRIDVQVCAALGDDQKPQSWSKYAKDSSIFKKLNGVADENDEKKNKANETEKKKKSKKDRFEEIFGEHKNDPKFIEFMKAHGKGNEIWDNDLGIAERTEDDIRGSAAANVAKDESDDDQGKGSSKNEGSTDEEISTKLADQSISDADYLETLKQKGSSTVKKETTDGERKLNDLFTIKIREIPFKTKRKDVKDFFKPVRVYSIRLPTRKHGFCYVGFKTEKEFNKAMLKNRSFLQGKQVILIDFTEKNKLSAVEKEESSNEQKPKSNPKWAKQEEALKNEEDISESGKIFFRNLTYTVTEDQLQELFGKYGPVADIHLPIDTVTRRIKGFGTVTYVMPENAVQAFSELDGSTFHGRLLHLIPGKGAEDNNEINTDGLSFKEKKELLQKKAAGSSHNWNTLFMGTNAIVNTLSKNYQTSKEAILDMSDGGSGAAVRLALGETEIVIEMRKFLEENDVVLNVFDNIPKKRSRTVILVKNLPAETTVSEIQSLFSKFGLLGRCVLPPSGITAIVEFLDAVEAKKAFSKLAYTKFKNLPLYLEWAPENTFKSNATKPLEAPKEVQNEEVAEKDSNKTSKDNPFARSKDTRTSKVTPTDEPEESYVINEVIKPKMTKTVPEDENDEDDTEPEPGTTLFLRNLKFTTQAETVREHFNHIGKIHHIQIAVKKDPEDPRNKIPLGYGFIQFKQKSSLEKALRQMQTTNIDGNIVELKRSDRTLQIDVRTNRKTAMAMKQTGTKILVRNIPFQAKPKEIGDLFKAFGEIKSIRIPKKMTPGEDSHRGFGFVDFTTKSDAKKAFDALSHSTHLYGRRLVLEWAAADEGVEELRKRTAEQFEVSNSGAKKCRKSVFEPGNIKISFNDDDNDGDF